MTKAETRRSTVDKATVDKKAKGTSKNWEEGKLGLSEEHAVAVSPEEMVVLNEALELKPISIRLQTSLINRLKIIAFHRGIGYQPLIRDILNRFAGHEIVRVMQQIEAEKEAESALTDEESPDARFIRH